MPAIKLQKSVQIGNTPVCLRLQYEVPLDAIDEPLKPPARFFIRYSPSTGPNPTLIMMSILYHALIPPPAVSGIESSGCELTWASRL